MFKLNSIISGAPYNKLSTPKPYDKPEGKKIAGKFYLEMKKLDCIRGIASGTLEVIGTDYVLMVRGTDSSAELFFANRAYIAEFKEAHYTSSGSLKDAQNIEEIETEFDGFRAIPHFLDALDEMPEELQGYIITNIPDFADYDVSDRVRRVLCP